MDLGSDRIQLEKVYWVNSDGSVAPAEATLWGRIAGPSQTQGETIRTMATQIFSALSQVNAREKANWPMVNCLRYNISQLATMTDQLYPASDLQRYVLNVAVAAREKVHEFKPRTVQNVLNESEIRELIRVLRGLGITDDGGLVDELCQSVHLVRITDEVRQMEGTPQEILAEIREGLARGRFTVHTVKLSAQYRSFDEAVAHLPPERQEALRATFDRAHQQALFAQMMRQSANKARVPFTPVELHALKTLGYLQNDDEMAKRVAINEAMAEVLREQMGRARDRRELKIIEADIQAQLRAVRLEAAGVPIERMALFEEILEGYSALDEEFSLMIGRLPGFSERFSELYPRASEFYGEVQAEDYSGTFYRLIGRKINRQIMQEGDRDRALQHLEKITQRALEYARKRFIAQHRGYLAKIETLYEMATAADFQREFIQDGDEVFKEGVCWAASIKFAISLMINPALDAPDLHFGDITREMRYWQARYTQAKRTGRAYEGVYPQTPEYARILEGGGIRAEIALREEEEQESYVDRFIAMLHESLPALQESGGVAMVDIYAKGGGGHRIAIQYETENQRYRIIDVNAFQLEKQGEGAREWADETLKRLLLTHYDDTKVLNLVQLFLR